ncbi:MAG: hypothetical protein ABIC40_08850 [bacterium]
MKPKEIITIIAIFGLIILGHVLTFNREARASGVSPLLLQSTGSAYSSYGATPKDQLAPVENQCRDMLYQIGASEMGYAQYVSKGKFAYLHELKLAGYLQPNASGGTLVGNYSITFFLPPGRLGFTLFAEPLNFELTPMMIDENQNVVNLVPTNEGDPNEDWADLNGLEKGYYFTNGFYYYPPFPIMADYETPIQVRLNAEKSEYVIFQFLKTEAEGPMKRMPDDSLIYISRYLTYLVGDTREFGNPYQFEPPNKQE